jgi:hypothetical protein
MMSHCETVSGVFDEECRDRRVTRRDDRDIDTLIEVGCVIGCPHFIIIIIIIIIISVFRGPAVTGVSIYPLFSPS